MSGTNMAMHYVCIIRLDGQEKYGLMACKTERNVADKDTFWTIHAFGTEAAGLAFFEDAYKRFHNRSYEGSMSACLNWMAYQPSIAHLALWEMEQLVEEYTVVHAWHVSGGMHYIPLRAADAKVIWDKGCKPTLIQDDWLQ